MGDAINRAKSGKMVYEHNKNRIVGRVLRDYTGAYTDDLLSLEVGGLSIANADYPELYACYAADDDTSENATEDWGEDYQQWMEDTYVNGITGSTLAINGSLYNRRGADFGVVDADGWPAILAWGKSNYGTSQGGVFVGEWSSTTGRFDWQDDIFGRTSYDQCGMEVRVHPTKRLILASSRYSSGNAGSIVLAENLSGDGVWTKTHTLSAAAEAGALFTDKAIEWAGCAGGDDLIIAGESQKDGTFTNVGRVYIYEADSDGLGVTHIQTIEAPSDVAINEYFGWLLDVDGASDGDYFACVRSMRSDTNTVAVFKRDTAAKTYTIAATISTGITTTGAIIADLAIVGDYVAIALYDTTDTENRIQFWKRDTGAETFTLMTDDQIGAGADFTATANVIHLTGRVDEAGTGAYFCLGGMYNASNTGGNEYWWIDGSDDSFTYRYVVSTVTTNYGHTLGLMKNVEFMLGPADPDLPSVSAPYYYQRKPPRYVSELFRSNTVIHDNTADGYGLNDYVVATSDKSV